MPNNTEAILKRIEVVEETIKSLSSQILASNESRANENESQLGGSAKIDRVIDLLEQQLQIAETSVLSNAPQPDPPV